MTNLVLLTFLPLVGALLILLAPKGSEALMRIAALVTTLATAVVGVATYMAFDGDSPSNVASVILMVDALPEDTGEDDTGIDGTPQGCGNNDIGRVGMLPWLAWFVLIPLVRRRRA